MTEKNYTQGTQLTFDDIFTQENKTRTIKNKSGTVYDVIVLNSSKSIALLKDHNIYVVACELQYDNDVAVWAQGYYFPKNPSDPFSTPFVDAVNLFLEKCNITRK